MLMGMDLDSKSVPEVIEGRKPEKSDEALASIELKRINQVQLGDRLKLNRNDHCLKIVGFTTETSFNVSPVVYTNLEQASFKALMPQEATEGNQRVAICRAPYTRLLKYCDQVFKIIDGSLSEIPASVRPA